MPYCADEQFNAIASWDAHPKSSISALGVAPSSDSALRVFTGASDGSIRVWKISEGSPEEVQKISYKGKLPLDIVASILPGSTGLSLHSGVIRVANG